MEEVHNFDSHGFFICPDFENETRRCPGCIRNDDDSVKQEDCKLAETPSIDKWIELLHAKELKIENEGTFDYETRMSELHIELKSLGWSSGDDQCNLGSLNDVVDLEMKKYDRETVPTNLSVMVQVLKDVDRTFPTHKMFMVDSSKKVQLFRILVLYARMNQAVGYCQGMAYVAALLLMYIENEEDVFWSFTYLLDNQLKHVYDSDLKRVKVLAEVVRILVNELYPELGSLLELTKVHPLMYSTQWFMGVFTGINCWDSVLYIVQLLFEQGIHSLINVALIILKSCEKTILAMSKLEEILPFLQNIPAEFIHQRCLESIVNKNGAHQFQSMDELEVYMKRAEERVNMEDKELEERKKQYITRSTRKRQRDESDDNCDNMPSKKNLSVVPSNTVKKRRYPVTPAPPKYITRSSVKTSSIKKTALDSVRKGRAELCYTKDAGLIYTSPNTMELKELPADRLTGPRSNKENTLAVKLSFDAYDHSDELHDCV